MEKLRLSKKQLAALATAFTIAGSTVACKSNKKELSDSSTTTKVTSVETTTEPTTVATTVETTKVEEQGLKYADEAESFYNANKDFFVNEYGNDKEYAIKEINDVILVITNDSETITNEDLRNALNAMDNMFMPTNVIQAAGNYVTDEPVEHFESVPNLGRYIQDDQAKQVINDNTAILNNFIKALNGKDEKEIETAKNLLLQRVITVENDLDEYYYLGELSNGDELALNMSMKGLVNLAGSIVENGVLDYTDANKVAQSIYLIPNARDAAIINTFKDAANNNIEFETQKIVKDGVETTIIGRNVEMLSPEGFKMVFVSLAENNRILDTLAITKYVDSVEFLENDFSRISAEYHSLNGDCDYTLTK